MRVIAYKNPGPIEAAESLIEIERETPKPEGRDLLVSIKAVSVNPVDMKIRASSGPLGDDDVRVLGWDASGIVEAVGPQAGSFQPGDEVFYAGSLIRPGTNAQFHLVDERIVGHKPQSLNWAQAAALPLTSITAWEALFDRLDVRKAVPGAANAIVIIGGAGGVGSIAIQLARQLTDLTVIATASRTETQNWAREMGAHHVIDHSKPLAPQIAELGIGAPGFVFSTTHTDRHMADIAEAIAPQGRFALIDDPKVVDIVPFKRKSVSVHWELMFTRPIFETVDIGAQGALLNEVAEMVDAGRIRTTLTEHLSPINVANLKKAHALVESAAMRGKVVLEGWA
ncbi:zinc-binding alcohol dehydrogenase family protein [Tianweitania sp. BSSL-BM11]|uniref:Zinc-type alcohol dehydrogenase-like protein n=1 Tax=Tianweitania aestuarii TaxID=2814886 RepID=A0ABS5RZV7_9HYPH|nr:zinc-binding alcohol dehydrogenase family protein [Tianweitania aestuarii]MBS9722588.1 zinc-binding alcohol dehydrogenase family protein [Tianweitania aestuarii]